MNRFHRRTLPLILAAGLVVAVAGCSRNDPASYIASAQTYLGKSDYKAAIIQLKNALQKAPDNGEARYLLAKSLFATGDAVGAETEVRKAIAAKYSDDSTIPLLAETMAAQGKLAEVTKELGDRKLGTPEARADLDGVLAAAHASKGDLTGAKTLADAALAEAPNDPRVLLLQAQLAGGRPGGLAAARDYIDRALKAAPDNVEVQLANAELTYAEGKPDESRKLLEQAVDAHPSSVAARSALFSVAFRAGKTDVAKAQVAKMKEVAPNDLRVIYADALLSASEGDNSHALQEVQRILGARPDHLPSLFLSGLLNYRLGAYGAAEDSLRKVITQVPDDPGTSRLLALTYLRTGRAQDATNVLAGALAKHPHDAVLLRTSGEAWLATGNTAQAEKAYEAANAIDKNNVGSEVRLAQVRLAAGDTARGFSDLEALAEKDSSSAQPDLALYTAHMQRREFDKALADVDTLAKKQPKSALIENLRGTVYMAKRDFTNARTSFTKSLELDPQYLPAARNLAILDLRDGNVKAARDRYEAMLAKKPDNAPVLIALAEVQGIAGDSNDAIKATIEKAVKADSTSPGPRLALIGFEARHGDPKGAVATAQTALAAIPKNPQLTEALGAAQLASGEANQALETFRSLAQLQPQNPLVLLRVAEAQVATKDLAGAIETEKKALALKPDLPATVGALTKTYLMAGKTDDAVATARGIQKEHPDKAGGYALEGEIMMAQKKWSEAALAFKIGLDRQPVPQLASLYYLALTNAGQAGDATAMAGKWMKAHPDDPTMPLLLAQQAQAQKRNADAKAGYEKVLAIDSNNIVALNNLAWMLGEEKNPKALEYAERAHQLAPFSPNVLDTLGLTLSREGDAKRAVQLLQMATRLAPNEPEIRLHFAQVLAQSGDKSGARKEATELTKLDAKSPVRVEAEKLLSTL